MSGPVGKDMRAPEGSERGDPLPVTPYGGDTFNDDMRKLAEEQEVEFLDINTVWHDYVAVSKTPFEWFHRDILHANDRGKQVLARILEKFFAPKK